jgi:hypothetical protein
VNLIATSIPFKIPIDQVDCYLQIGGPLAGAVFVSLKSDHRTIPDSWLSMVELTDQGRLLTPHYSANTLRIRGHEPKEIFDDACHGQLGEVQEYGGLPRPRGLWMTRFEWNFPIERSDLASLSDDITEDLK